MNTQFQTWPKSLLKSSPLMFLSVSAACKCYLSCTLTIANTYRGPPTCLELCKCSYLCRQIGNTQMIKQTFSYTQICNYRNTVPMGTKGWAESKAASPCCFCHKWNTDSILFIFALMCIKTVNTYFFSFFFLSNCLPLCNLAAPTTWIISFHFD